MKAILVCVFLLKISSMKYFLLTIFTVILIGCKNQSNENTESSSAKEVTEEKTLTTAEAIAYKYGFEHWNEVNKIAFTFNVDQGENHFERSFIWKPETGAVEYTQGDQVVSFMHLRPQDSIQTQADKAFLNDKYWLLTPFQLVWDKNLTITEAQNVTAPISKETLNKLTIVYPEDGGGYTPGDAYDFYFDNEYVIKEWVFRKGNDKEPTMIRSWESPKQIGNITFTTEFLDEASTSKIYFTNISIK